MHATDEVEFSLLYKVSWQFWRYRQYDFKNWCNKFI